jgi:hypothetical protein
VPITARKVETALVEHAHDLGHSAELHEQPEHKPKPLLYCHIGILDDYPAWVAHQADRQRELEFSPFGFGEKAGGQATADCVKFKL